MKIQLCLSILALFATSVSAQPFSTNSEKYNDFMAKRTFLPDDITAVRLAAIQSLVGEYVTRSNNEATLQGRNSEIPASAATVNLKNSFEVRTRVTGEQAASASFLELFGGSGTKDTLDELIIRDIVSVTDPSIRSDTCKKPSSFESTQIYWCISGAVLTEIKATRYDKVSKIARGGYGFVNANGTFSAGNESSSTTFKITILAVGPMKNGILLQPSDVPDLTNPRIVTESMLETQDRAFKLKKPVENGGLAGLILSALGMK